MTLVIKVISADPLFGNEQSIRVGHMGATIGRGEENDLVLPDPERIVSHRHAIIHYEQGHYFLEDASTNGTFVNRNTDAVGKNQRVPLQHGDLISIGNYECCCLMEDERDEAPEREAYFNDGESFTPTGPDQSMAPAEPYIPESPDPGLLYDEGNGESPQAEPFDFLQPQVAEKQAVSPQVSPEKEPYIPQPVREAIPEDWELQDEMIPPPPRARTPQPAPDLTKAPRPPKPATPVSVRKKAARAQPPTGMETTAVAAFLKGLGLSNLDLSAEDIPAMMELSGKLLREMTRGIYQVLNARSVIKGEFRLGQTMMRPSDNNPLKFAVDVEDTLVKLLTTPKGYLAPLTAVQEAIDDMQAHNMATLAGLRAALSTLIEWFNPKSLEKKFQDGSFLDNLLPAAKKARCWDMFKEIYGEAAADAENDFLHLLGDEFAKAYNTQISKLKAARLKEQTGT